MAPPTPPYLKRLSHSLPSRADAGVCQAETNAGTKKSTLHTKRCCQLHLILRQLPLFTSTFNAPEGQKKNRKVSKETVSEASAPPPPGWPEFVKHPAGQGLVGNDPPGWPEFAKLPAGQGLVGNSPAPCESLQNIRLASG